MTDRRTRRAAAAATTTTTLTAWAELRDELEDDLDELEDVVAGGPRRVHRRRRPRRNEFVPRGGARAASERESIEDDSLQFDESPGWIQAAGRA